VASADHLQWFRERLQASAPVEPRDPAPILQWRDSLIPGLKFSAELIGLSKLARWTKDANGNVVHDSGQFFSIEGVRVTGATEREVLSWDQPIFNQIEGGILALLAREDPNSGVQFLLQAKAEPGNIGWLQLCPTIQCTQSNLNRAHRGRRPPLAEVLLLEEGVRLVYHAFHNEEGGRFWRKSNDNRIVVVSDSVPLDLSTSYFHWASLTQIKSLALVDNVLSPFVKTIIAPL
jgi:dTDP-4-dehydro-6-deoxy-alpha-D-glucopyranose 2,3-dehydratase